MGYAFISYSSKQQKAADQLRVLLQANHIDLWMAPYDLPDGTDYADVINNVIQNAACFVLLLTEDAQNSIYIDKEIERALHYGKTIAPIQMDHAALNDSFSFYLCNQQIITVSAIDASAPKIQSLLQHLRLLCNDQLPEKEACSDSARDRRVNRHKVARLFCWFGGILLLVSLLCGHEYIYYSARGTYEELYGIKYIPALGEIAHAYIRFLLLAVVAVLAYLYGYGLKDPKKKTWNPIQILNLSQIPPAFATLCGIGCVMLRFIQKSVAAIIRGLEIYHNPTDGYILPQWVIPTTWILGIACAAFALLSLVLAFVRDKRNGFAFAKNLRSKLPAIAAHRKKDGK